MLALAHLHFLAGGLRLDLQVVEREDAVDVDDGEARRVTIHLQLLWAASQLQLIVELDVGQGVLVHSSTHSADDERLGPSCNRANEVHAAEVRLDPSLFVINAVGIWQFFDVEGVLLARLLFLLLLQRAD